MREEEIRKIKGRLRRLEGQLKGVESMISAGGDDPMMVIIQLKAVIAASKGCLNEYAQNVVLSTTDEKTRQSLLKILLAK